MKEKLYTWDEIYLRAENKSFGSCELKAKDEARGQMENLIEEETGKDIRNNECPEDDIFDFIKNEATVLFDIYGNIMLIQRGNKL